MVKILTSGFTNGFPNDFIRELKTHIKIGGNFVFIASDFEGIYQKTDSYCSYFLKMFSECGIDFQSIEVIDSRVSKETAKDIVRNANIIWLAGGDTSKQFTYLKSYGLIEYIREQKGVGLKCLQ